MKIAFLIRSLGFGGAERQLVNLAIGLARKNWRVSVAVFYAGGPLEEELRRAGVPVESIGKRHRYDVLGVSRKLATWLRRERPDVLHSYLTVSNILAALVSWFLPTSRIVWGIRASALELNAYDRLTRFTERGAVWLARRAALVIANSEAGRAHCLAVGYPRDRIIVILNGIDTDRFCPDPAARARIRGELGVKDGEKLIGLVGRLDPMKGHRVFLEAASLLAMKRKDVHFVCMGEGPAEYKAELISWTQSREVSRLVHWLPPRKDMPAVYNAFDILSSPSLFGEGFSNALAEAMACGVPCVATAVGDSASVLGSTGCVVRPRDPEALCQAWETVLHRVAEEGEYLKRQCRERIVSNYSNERLIAATKAAIENLIAT